MLEIMCVAMFYEVKKKKKRFWCKLFLRIWKHNIPIDFILEKKAKFNNIFSIRSFIFKLRINNYLKYSIIYKWKPYSYISIEQIFDMDNNNL